MGIVHFSIPKTLVLEIIRNIHVKNFVETGTYKGDTSVWASRHFGKVYTIEISPELSKEASERKDAGKNMEFLIGDSKSVLPQLAKQIKGRTFFWLDGHWCMGAAGKDAECPLLEELEAIQLLQDSIIFIDDARCFLGPLPAPHRSDDWPMIDTILKRIAVLFPSHRTTIIDDVIIAVPADVYPTIARFWMNTFSDRYETSKRRRIKKYLKSVKSKIHLSF